ncbi:hypothetical protein [Streptomonospora arabica]|uniref:Uncharacterized protein n=1 Tax=Streptomonospora arabica TaxID=412417 RepID=A0ABV9SH15_9ACTN
MSALEIVLSRDDGPVDAAVFFDSAGTAIDLVQQVERASGGARTAARWGITELRSGSAIVVAAPIGENQSADLAGELFVNGVRELDHSARIPPAFTLDVLRGLLRMAKEVEQGNTIRFELVSKDSDPGAGPATVTLDLARHARQLLTARHLEFAAVQGEIDRIDVRGSKREVSIFDTEQNRSVRATFADSMLPAVVENIKRRVAVWGLVRKTAAGQILSFQIERLEVLEDRPLMSIRDIAGIAPWWTGGEDPTEWIRGRREEE